MRLVFWCALGVECWFGVECCVGFLCCCYLGSGCSLFGSLGWCVDGGVVALFVGGDESVSLFGWVH